MRIQEHWFRHHAPDVPADLATTRAWRWNPEGVRTLYLASTPERCRLELLRLMERAGFREDEVLPRALTRSRVRLRDVVFMRTEDELASRGLRRADVEGRDLRRCRRASRDLIAKGSEAILAISGVGEGETLAVFRDKLLTGSRVQAGSTRRMGDVSSSWTWPEEVEE